VLWRTESPTPDEQQTIDELTGLRFIYRRVGHDDRWLSFGKDRLVLDGAALRERLRHVNQVDGAAVLTLSRLDRPTCHLRLDPDGIWRGSCPNWPASAILPASAGSAATGTAARTTTSSPTP
jgi:hypothetical protein